MIAGFALLLMCQLVGEMVVRGLGLPLPGPVLGMGLLVLTLGVWTSIKETDHVVDASHPVGRVADGLLGSLGLMFVPAGVGIVQYFGLIGTYGVALVSALVLSTVVTLAVTVATFVAIKRLFSRPDEETRS
jgi:holin-like protein